MRAAADTSARPADDFARDGAPRRKLAAILCADIAGFSRLMGDDEAATYDGLAVLRGAIDPLIARHGGRIVSTAGDGLLADFASVVDALSCAVAMQEAAAQLNEPLPPNRRLELRIGVNLGDVIVADDGDLYGDGVNIAARLQSLAATGGICLSQPVYDQVGNKLDLGYRPLGKHRVKNIATPVSVYAVGPAPAKVRASRQTLRPLTVAVICTLIIINTGLVVWLLKREWPGAAEAAAPVATLAAPARLAERTAVAVLPFKNLSPDAGQDFFSDGITEDIINALGRFSNLLVAAKSASFQFKGRNVSPEEAGRTLSARYLVEGSVRRASEKLRTTVELTDAATGRHLWSEDYNTEMKDVFSVQDDITRQIVAATAIKLTVLERQRVQQKPTANLAAYEYVLRARTDGNSPTRAANDDARNMLQRAIELDPDYAGAYVALGFTHWEAVVSGWTEFPADELGRAETLAAKALALDPATTRAHLLLAWTHSYRRETERALAEVDQALAINPSDAECYGARGAILTQAGNGSEAVPWLEVALRLGGPSPGTYMNLGTAKYFLGRYGEAIDALDRALGLDPGRMHRFMSHPVRAAAYARLGKQVEVLRERTIIDRLSPFFDAERFAAQFGTKQARDAMLTGLREAGFK